MNIEDLLGTLGGDQLQRVLQIVSQVDDNWDGLMQAVDFITDHGEDLIDLLGRLPDILDRAGEALGTAAEAAVDASSFLTAGDGLDADDIAGSAGKAMAVCQEHLSSVAKLLERVGDELGGIKVPAFDIERSEVMGLSVVSGIDVKTNRVAAGAARDVQASASQLAEVADALAAAGDGLGRLQSNLGAAGSRINALASDVEASGLALTELSGSSTTSRRQPKRKAKKPAARKPSAKKRTATKKKAPAKKTTARKTTARKTATKKVKSTNRTAAKKTTKKTTAKRTTAKRTTAKRAATKPTTTPRTATKKKTTTKKTTSRKGKNVKLGKGVLRSRGS